MPEKDDLRRQIDALDEELLTLLNRRQSLAQAIGRIKNQEGARTLDFRREEEVVAHILSTGHGADARTDRT